MIMPELAMHVLDIAQNSISAGAKHVKIVIDADRTRNILTIAVVDDGCGMDDEMEKRVLSPFTTSRTTRKVGLGIPFFKLGAECCDGNFELKSEKGIGTSITATYSISHIDRPPIGDIAETIAMLVICNEKTDFVLSYTIDGKTFIFDTEQIKIVLGDGIPLTDPDVMGWIRDYLCQGIEEINGGIDL
ncbi:MAG: sensor histidine kinase [Clostridia bacterium]|nr:sensor histidine kinase [Clostridia bacterium]